MKKWILIISLLIVVATSAVAYGMYHLMPERNRVQLNPFVHEKYTYVQIDNTHVQPDSHGAVEYTLPAWSEDGTMQETTFTGLKKLREGAYIRLVSKGSYVQSYSEVQASELPAAVSSHFKQATGSQGEAK